jgi:DNA polymerase III epsilon subunit-like protein
VIDNDVVFLDTETTGLSMDHDIWEVAYVVGDDPFIHQMFLPHSLKNADPTALELNGYYTRFNRNDVSVHGDLVLRELLKDKTIVGANPSFDAYRIQRRLGVQPWHYRMVDVESMAIPVMGLTKPPSLKDIVAFFNEQGFHIPENDHTAKADVHAVREVYKLLLTSGWNKV